MSKKAVKKLALECGFKLKEQPDGSMDLNTYVYEFADKLIKQTHITLLGDFKDMVADITSQINDAMLELQ